MQPDIAKALEEQREKIDQIYASVEKTRKYFLWTMIITLALVILPLLGLIFALPAFLSTYTTDLQSLGL